MKKLLLILIVCAAPMLYAQDYSHNEDVMEKRWHKNGQLEFEGNYQYGKKHGQHKWWYPNGQLEFEEHYVNGKKHGLFKGWWKNGQLDYEGVFKYNQRDSLWRAYYENGQLRQETDFILQRKLSEQCFEENGDPVDCEEDIQGIWWWKDEKCFDEKGNEIDCNDYYLGAF